MIKIENTEVFGWEAAIRGMRNPKNSCDKSDSLFGYKIFKGLEACHFDNCPLSDGQECSGCDLDTLILGENDLKLMKTLAKAGADHGKFLRMINVTVDLTAPLYWWKEFDTYKVGTVANSCSTMHKIHAKEFTLDDFSHEQLDNNVVCIDNSIGVYNALEMLSDMIDMLNACRNAFLETKDKQFWWQMIQLLPTSYNQKRTVQLNYAVLKNMYFARRHHKLDEWHTLCDWMLELPYFKEICVQEE